MPNRQGRFKNSIFSLVSNNFAEPTITTTGDECENDEDCKDNAEKTKCDNKKCTGKQFAH